MDELFNKNQKILIAATSVDGKNTDIFIDETGSIAGIGEGIRKTHKGEKFTLQRYKGLGEMDPQQLWETTLDPATRRLRRIEIGDARLSSDVTEILMGTDVPPRKDFIYDHAQDAELDV